MANRRRIALLLVLGIGALPLQANARPEAPSGGGSTTGTVGAFSLRPAPAEPAFSLRAAPRPPRTMPMLGDPASYDLSTRDLSTAGVRVLDPALFGLAGAGVQEGEPPFCCDRRHFGKAAAYVLMVELIPWFFNRHVADDETAELSFESWGRNIREGFEWDTNDFRTNMFMHPYHGSLYFNAARNNGYTFWESAAFAWGGSFLWEMFGENNRGAINDWVATSMGGTTIGEAFFRSARAIRDNTATGSRRGVKELLAFPLDPMAGVNRAIRGEASRVGANPEGRRPQYFGTISRLGARSIGIDEEGNDLGAGAFFGMDLYHGDPFKENRDPFDSFELRFQLNRRESKMLGRLQIDGVLFGRQKADTEEKQSMYSLNQLYDYVNTTAFEVGGQSFGFTYRWHRKLSDTWTLRSKVQPTAAALWAVSSDIVEEAEGRSYDFGSGLGFRGRVYFDHRGRELIEIFYVGQWSHTLSGAAGNHVVQFLGARGAIPVWRNIGVGAAFVLAARDSFYRDHDDVSLNGKQVQLYLQFF